MKPPHCPALPTAPAGTGPLLHGGKQSALQAFRFASCLEVVLQQIEHVSKMTKLRRHVSHSVSHLLNSTCRVLVLHVNMLSIRGKRKVGVDEKVPQRIGVLSDKVSANPVGCRPMRRSQRPQTIHRIRNSGRLEAPNVPTAWGGLLVRFLYRDRHLSRRAPSNPLGGLASATPCDAVEAVDKHHRRRVRYEILPFRFNSSFCISSRSPEPAREASSRHSSGKQCSSAFFQEAAHGR